MCLPGCEVVVVVVVTVVVDGVCGFDEVVVGCCVAGTSGAGVVGLVKSVTIHNQVSNFQ